MKSTIYLIATLTLALQGCAALSPTEGDQLASSGPVGIGDVCAFGGVTQAAERHCAARAFGIWGELAALNRQVDSEVRARGGDCKDHALTADRLLQDKYPTEIATSCPLYLNGICHVTLIVKTEEGQFVMDNGAIRLSPGNEPLMGNVAPLDLFVAAVDGEYGLINIATLESSVDYAQRP